MENKSNPRVSLILDELNKKISGRGVCLRNAIFFGLVAHGNWRMHCPGLDKPRR